MRENRFFYPADSSFSILIPFVVLQELDHLKRREQDSMVSLKSSRAIKYINEQLKSKNQRMQGKQFKSLFC